MSQFANITHYNDLKNLIADRPEFVFKYEEETNTYVVKYNLLLAGSFDHEDDEARKLLVEARGITFDADTGEVVSRKYHKFYNIGEKTCSQIQNIDFSKTHWVMEKLDGSNISNIRNLSVPVTKAGRSDVSKMVDEIFLRPEYVALNKFCSEMNLTAQYEFCSRRQRIVVDYSVEQLVLTGIRHNVTGEYVYNPDELKEVGEQYGIPVVDSYKVTNQKIEDIIEEIREAHGIEGIIIRFEDGSMYKVKSEEYVRYHNAVSRVKQEKDVVKIILNDELDDVLPIVSEIDAISLRKFADDMINGINESTHQCLEIGKKFYSDNQKDFALAVLAYDPEKKYSRFILGNRVIFDRKDDVKAFETVQALIQKTIMFAASSGPKLNDARYLFNAQFNNMVIEE